MWIQLCSLIHTRTQHTKNNPKPQTPTNLFSLSAFSKMCALDYNSKTPRSSGYLLALSRHAIVFKLSFFFSLSLCLSLSVLQFKCQSLGYIYIYTQSCGWFKGPHLHNNTDMSLFQQLVELRMWPGTRYQPTVWIKQCEQLHHHLLSVDILVLPGERCMYRREEASFF